MFRQAVSIIILMAFISTSVKSPAYGSAPLPWMPNPGVRVSLSPEFTPANLKGMVIHPDNALQFDFLIQRGDQLLSADQKQAEYKKLIKYFLASLAIPDENQWVNLSPYEKSRIIKDDFGKTEMGRDLLGQDYILKQLTSSLIYPESNLGKKFWDEVYSRAYQEYGTTNIPVNTFNKVWIVPDEALIFEKGNMVYIVKHHLKVMLEEDYLSLKKHTRLVQGNSVNKLGSQMIREIVLPAIEKEVNEGKNFANLRQIYSGMILAAWYKRTLKESLLGKIYADKARIKGVNQPDPGANEVIYRQYMQAFKKGVFNFIKEDVDKYTHEAIPRKYFSGGTVSDGAMYSKEVRYADQAQLGEDLNQMIEKKDVLDDADVTLREEQPNPEKEAITVQIQHRSDGNLGDGTGQLISQLKEEPRRLVGNISGIVTGISSQSSGISKIVFRRGKDEMTYDFVGALPQDYSPHFVPSYGVQIFFENGAWVRVAAPLSKNHVDTNLTVESSRSDIIPARALLERILLKYDIKLVSTKGPAEQVSQADKETFTVDLRGMGDGNQKLINQLKEAPRPLVVNILKILSRSSGDIGSIFLHLKNNKLLEYTWDKLPQDNLLNFSVLDGVQIYFKDKTWLRVAAPNRTHLTVETSLPLAPGKVSPVMLAEGIIAKYDIKLTEQGIAMIGEAKLSAKPKDGAMVTQQPLGGIDLNAANLNLQIKRDGRGVPLPISRQDWEHIRIDGLIPVIIDIRPASNIMARV
jgi:hypothetical protein